MAGSTNTTDRAVAVGGLVLLLVGAGCPAAGTHQLKPSSHDRPDAAVARLPDAPRAVDAVPSQGDAVATADAGAAQSQAAPGPLRCGGGERRYANELAKQEVALLLQSLRTKTGVDVRLDRWGESRREVQRFIEEKGADAVAQEVGRLWRLLGRYVATERCRCPAGGGALDGSRWKTCLLGQVLDGLASRACWRQPGSDAHAHCWSHVLTYARLAGVGLSPRRVRRWRQYPNGTEVALFRATQELLRSGRRRATREAEDHLLRAAARYLIWLGEIAKAKRLVKRVRDRASRNALQRLNAIADWRWNCARVGPPVPRDQKLPAWVRMLELYYLFQCRYQFSVARRATPQQQAEQLERFQDAWVLADLVAGEHEGNAPFRPDLLVQRLRGLKRFRGLLQGLDFTWDTFEERGLGNRLQARLLEHCYDARRSPGTPRSHRDVYGLVCAHKPRALEADGGSRRVRRDAGAVTEEVAKATAQRVCVKAGQTGERLATARLFLYRLHRFRPKAMAPGRTGSEIRRWVCEGPAPEEEPGVVLGPLRSSWPLAVEIFGNPWAAAALSEEQADLLCTGERLGTAWFVCDRLLPLAAVAGKVKRPGCARSCATMINELTRRTRGVGCQPTRAVSCPPRRAVGNLRVGFVRGGRPVYLEVYVDKKKIGTTPVLKPLELTEGEHRVHFADKDRVHPPFRVVIEAGKTTRVECSGFSPQLCWGEPVQ